MVHHPSLSHPLNRNQEVPEEALIWEVLDGNRLPITTCHRHPATASFIPILTLMQALVTCTIRAQTPLPTFGDHRALNRATMISNPESRDGPRLNKRINSTSMHTPFNILVKNIVLLCFYPLRTHGLYFHLSPWIIQSAVCIKIFGLCGQKWRPFYFQITPFALFLGF